MSMNVRTLRSRWKPIKEQLSQAQSNHPTAIRFHRACSWLQKAEALQNDDPDMTLTCQWIAFNALYGQWNEMAGEPLPDRQSWRQFLTRMIALDRDQVIANMLNEHKPLIMSILDDNYLRDYFWKDPSAARARNTTRDRREASMWYVDKRWGMILERVVEPVYFLRCQIMHGAATHGSKLNRTSLKRCSILMWHLMHAVLTVWIDHGSQENWGPLCYQPVTG
jgi:hypothetical protein